MNLKFCRLARNLRQIDLANKAKIHAPVLSLIENGLKTPTSKERNRLENVLKMRGMVDWQATAGKEKIRGR